MTTNSESTAATRDNGGLPPSAYQLLAFLCVAAAVCYAQRQAMAVAKEPLQLERALSKNEVGWILSAFFAGYSLFQVPLGWVGDTYGARRSLAICVALSALATALLPLAGTFTATVALWMLCGAAQAGLFPISASLIVASFPGTRRAMASGALASSMSIGAAVMSAVAGKLLGSQIDWKFVFLLAAVPGFVWGGAFVGWYRESPVHAAARRTPLEGQVRKLLATPALWLICGQQFLRAAGYVFYASWFSTYLQEAKSLDIERAGQLNGLPLAAVVVGSPVGGLISDSLLARTGNRRLSQQGVAIVSLLTCAGLIAPAFWVEDPLTATLLITAGSFFAAISGPVSYAVTMHFGGERVGSVFGIMNMCGNLGAMVFPAVAPQLRTLTGDWSLVLVVFAGIYVAAAVCWMFLNPDVTLRQT
ncbi:MAG TPA: MFS transporter [Pirellulales bacterium]|nr:MFS transporter [Pirellulales bacterium]